MPNTDQRRIAADARRIASRDTSEKATKALREALKDNYERGRQAGREEMRTELSGTDGRRALLDVAAEFVDLVSSRVSAIPNSTGELRACREASAILRDASKGGEAEPTMPEAKPKPKARKARKKD